MTPIQLLKLSKKDRLIVNAMYGEKTEIPEIKGLRPLFPGQPRENFTDDV